MNNSDQAAGAGAGRRPRQGFKVVTGEVQLTPLERLLITNFRAMKDAAKHTLVDVSEEWACALPATQVQLNLVR